MLQKHESPEVCWKLYGLIMRVTKKFFMKIQKKKKDSVTYNMKETVVISRSHIEGLRIKEFDIIQWKQAWQGEADNSLRNKLV